MLKAVRASCLRPAFHNIRRMGRPFPQCASEKINAGSRLPPRQRIKLAQIGGPLVVLDHERAAGPRRGGARSSSTLTTASAISLRPACRSARRVWRSKASPRRRISFDHSRTAANGRRSRSMAAEPLRSALRAF